MNSRDNAALVNLYRYLSVMVQGAPTGFKSEQWMNIGYGTEHRHSVRVYKTFMVTVTYYLRVIYL